MKFDRMVAEATGGNKTYMQTFEDLGIKIKDSAGNLRQPNEIFEDVADIFIIPKTASERPLWRLNCSASRVPI